MILNWWDVRVPSVVVERNRINEKYIKEIIKTLPMIF